MVLSIIMHNNYYIYIYMHTCIHGKGCTKQNPISIIIGASYNLYLASHYTYTEQNKDLRTGHGIKRTHNDR